MAPAAVGFHPAAAQEAESAYDWYAARNPAVATRRRRGPNLAARPTAGRRPSLPPPDCLLQLSTCLGARRVQVAPRAAAARRVRRAEASRLAPPVRLAPRALDARPARASQPARCAPGAPYAPASR